MLLKAQAATEAARFLAYRPTPEQIIAFHPSPEVAARAYELILRTKMARSRMKNGGNLRATRSLSASWNLSNWKRIVN